MFNISLIENADSYTFSHPYQYPPETEFIHAGIYPRGGQYPEVLFFGLQAYVKEYLLNKPITEDDVNEAAELTSEHGVPFYKKGWMQIVRECGGRLPLLIQAVPEGTVLPTGNMLVTVENTIRGTAWVVSSVESSILRGIWYPTSVATVSKNILEILKNFYGKTSDSADGYLFGLHDFGARAATSLESAALGGLAHLVNFRGTDTFASLRAAQKYYKAVKAAGFSLPAAAHTTITAWGKEREVDAYRNILKHFAMPGSIVAIVSDSYDIYNAVEKIWGETLREEVIASGASVVIRPDSGTPSVVVPRVITMLDSRFGSTANRKGYKVLNHKVRAIQGDAVNAKAVWEIGVILMDMGYSIENVNFGMGHELLQAVKRDTEGFKMATSAVYYNGEWHDAYKDPVTDSKKKSFKGRQMLYRRPDGSFFTDVLLPAENGHATRMLEPVYANGMLVKEYAFDDIRERANSYSMKTI